MVVKLDAVETGVVPGEVAAHLAEEVHHGGVLQVEVGVVAAGEIVAAL